MRILSSAILFTLCLTIGFSQNGWNWPEDPDLKSQALEKEAHYKVLMAQSLWNDAMTPLGWLYTNNANLNPSIYINGVKCLNNVLKEVTDKERKTRLQDSILWMYDQRLQHFDNDASTVDRKAYEAFKMYYRTPAKYGLLADLFDQAYNLNGPDISYFNLNTYMMLATNYYKSNPDEMPAEKVLDIHTRISDVIAQQKAAGGNQERLEKEQGKVDGFLGSIDNILNCDFIANTLVPKFRENPSDISTAKKIFRYSVSAKCTSEDYFLEASETILENSPTFALSSAVAKKSYASGDLAKAEKYHAKSLELAANSDEKADALLGLAQTASKSGKKGQARKHAYEALSEKPGFSDAYNLIGNLYFTSFKECQEQESKVIDRAVFLAAYKMYEKAGNKAQMQASKEQFPSIEEIFSESYEEGQDITVGCWINETVTIQRR